MMTFLRPPSDWLVVLAAVLTSLIIALCTPAVAYPGIFSGGGVQQIQLRTEGRENGVWGRQTPSQGFRSICK
jgi:hypothetical protein